MSSTAIATARAARWDYLELTKPRITLMVTLTALLGFVMGSGPAVETGPLLAALLGTALVAAGASCLNMLLETDTDARMLRTRDRPLPAGRVKPTGALRFGLALTLAGLVVLWWRSGSLAAEIALVTWATYLFWYTPLKTRTSLATIVGALPGALPPVIGWAAARGSLDAGAFVLFAILFVWQIPHFLAIAWIYRDDYARAGLPMLPVLDREGHLTGRQAVANSVSLLLISLMPALTGMAGRLYLAGAVALGVGLILVASRTAVSRQLKAARHLFLSSIAYLASLVGLLLLDRVAG